VHQITEEDFRVIHHDWGKLLSESLQRQAPLFQSSANDGFHEAWSTIASVTPEY